MCHKGFTTSVIMIVNNDEDGNCLELAAIHFLKVMVIFLFKAVSNV